MPCGLKFKASTSELGPWRTGGWGWGCLELAPRPVSLGAAKVVNHSIPFHSGTWSWHPGGETIWPWFPHPELQPVLPDGQDQSYEAPPPHQFPLAWTSPQWLPPESLGQTQGLWDRIWRATYAGTVICGQLKTSRIFLKIQTTLGQAASFLRANIM